MEYVYVVIQENCIMGVYSSMNAATAIAQAIGGRVSCEPIVK